MRVSLTLTAAYDAAMAVRHVESTANPLVKELVGLRQRRTRESSGNYIVEGAREARRALSAGVGARLVVVAPGLLREGEGSDAWQGAAEAAGAELVTFSTQAFERVSLREHPDGVLLVARSRRLAPEDVALPPGALVLVLVGLEKPGNVGALLRSADAVGVDAVFMCPDPGPGPGDREADFEEVREAHWEPTRGVDLESPNVIRAAMGSSFALPIGVGTPAEVVARLRAADLRLVAATPHADLTHWQCDLKGGVALVVGREHAGLSDWWLRQADARVAIPMRGSAADSLNVSVAGAVLLYEALRQRFG